MIRARNAPGADRPRRHSPANEYHRAAISRRAAPPRLRTQPTITARVNPGSKKIVGWYMVAPVLSSAWLHADGPVETDGLAVEHPVLEDVRDQRRVLRGTAEPGREGNLLAERRARGLGQAGQHRRFEDAGRDGADPDAELGEIARDRKRHADHAALGGRVGGLTDLPLERGHGGGVDDHPALALAVGLVL